MNEMTLYVHPRLEMDECYDCVNKHSKSCRVELTEGNDVRGYDLEWRMRKVQNGYPSRPVRIKSEIMGGKGSEI